MESWHRADHRLFAFGRTISGHAVFLIRLALTATPFVLALAAAWIGFAFFAALGLEFPGFLVVVALLAFLWRYVYVPVVARAVADAADALRARGRAHR